VDEAKPFKIPKWEVWEAFKKIKASQTYLKFQHQAMCVN